MIYQQLLYVHQLQFWTFLLNLRRYLIYATILNLYDPTVLVSLIVSRSTLTRRHHCQLLLMFRTIFSTQRIHSWSDCSPFTPPAANATHRAYFHRRLCSQSINIYFSTIDPLTQAPYHSISNYFTFRATEIQYFSYGQHPTLNPTTMVRLPRALSPTQSSLRSTSYPSASLAEIEVPPHSPLTGPLSSTCHLV